MFYMPKKHILNYIIFIKKLYNSCGNTPYTPFNTPFKKGRILFFIFYESIYADDFNFFSLFFV